MGADAAELRAGTFAADATPPLGSPLCGGGVLPAQVIGDPLSARGIVLWPEGQAAIVLCAVDWVGIANDAHDAFREAIAAAVGTEVSRVAVHTLHQHDAPFADFATEALIAEYGFGGRTFNPEFTREVIARVAEAAGQAKADAKPITHIGYGKGRVEMVASNRRVLGDDGKVKGVRWTATKDPELRAAPEGTIDPYAKSVSFWNGDVPVAELTYYATHPQSYYGQGSVSADFVGMARSKREEAMPGFAHIHFCGAAGNVGAGKYNDGDPANRPVLAERLAAGMARAWEDTERVAVGDVTVAWDVAEAALPVREETTLEAEMARLADGALDEGSRIRAAREIAWMTRRAEGRTISVPRLRIGPVQILHLPGELFVEYQLAAEAMAPDSFVCMAAYGDYAPGYIGTTESYDQGGYEIQLYTSRTAPSVEPGLLATLEGLLKE